MGVAMTVKTSTIRLSTRGNADMIDLTEQVGSAIISSNIKDGIVTIFCPSATSALTTIEYESRVLQDFRNILHKLIPKGAGYQHDLIDSNAHSHLRASIIGPSISLTIENGQLQLGTWQQPVFVCLDVRARSRKVSFTIIGE